MGASAGPGFLGFIKKVERIFNNGIDVLAMTNVGQTELACLSEVDVENELFFYDSTYCTVNPKYDGFKNLTLFSNVDEGAATADIVFLVEASLLKDSGFEPVTGGLMKEYSVDGSNLQISTVLDMKKNMFYRVTLFNADGGDVTYTSDSYVINGNDVINPAFLLIMTT